METHKITNGLTPQPQRATGDLLKVGVKLAKRYLIEAQIGMGGMSTVYKARDMHFPNVVKWVAVKEMINQARDPLVRKTIVQNFEREANILATLHHPSIPRIFDYFTEDNRSYLVLEFIEGSDLEALLNQTQGFFPEEQVVGWALELCDVLTYLHGHRPEPIIFRDMKPSNVMLNQHGHIMLVDFGIAKHFQTGQKGTMIGTEGYAPPEQYRGEATHLSDIYALGATLHHLLTRKDPRTEAPFYFTDMPIRRINASVSPELEAVINTAVQYNPENRFQSAKDMQQALLHAARKTGLLATISLATRQITAAPSEIQPKWKFECEDEIRGSATVANDIVYVGCYDNNIYALNATDGSFLWKYATEGGIVSRPCVYDNNVFIGSEDHRVHVVSARAGRLVWTYFTDGPIRSSPTIADGHLFIGSDDGHLHAVNVISGRRAWRIDVGSPVRSTPFVSSADENIYFGSEDGMLYCADFRGQIRWRFRAKKAITGSPIVHDGTVYFGSMDSTLYALDAQTGWVLWRYRLGRATISTPAIAEKMLFIGAADNAIYCLDARSSKEIWRFETENQVASSPVIHKDSLFCGSADGNLYCLEYRSGRLQWQFSTHKPITGTPVIHNDTVYIGSFNHFLYALPVSAII
ncbi:MAG: PQQ-binding-like beta-propeller repeat protein [Anaerolineales bacterium]